MKRIGLHVRVNGSFLELAHKAIRLKLSFFQCFFVSLSTSKLIRLSKRETDEFLALRQKYFDQLYLHGSYWINLASLQYNGYQALKKELALAKKLAFTHMILHSGFAKGAHERLDGIDALAKALNILLAKEDEINIVLENTAHGNLTVGSDITDFKYLLEKIDKPEKLFFSVDTAHAYSFGYDIRSEKGQDDFIQLLNDVVGLDRIVLIHLNDTKEKCGSRIDCHDVPGQGNIGEAALKRFIFHPQLEHVPVVMELPILPEEQEAVILQKVIDWYKT